MADIDQDPRVAELLTTAGHEANRFIHPDGVQAVQKTVRRRRRNRVIGAGVVTAAVLIGGPAAAVGLHRSPAPDKTPADTVTSTTTTTPTTAPTQTPSVSTSPSSPAPDGKISADALRNATLTIPAWPSGNPGGFCPTGKIHFSNGNAGKYDILTVGDSPVIEDVNGDGTPEAVALVSCSSGGTDYQVLAFDRGADGKIVTLGQVLGNVSTGGPRGTVRSVWAVEAADGGQVRIKVGDYGPPCCTQAATSQYQWRTYGWNGTRFTQTGGPTSFGANPNATDLSATTNGLTMTKQADGTWRGTLTVTVRNAAAFVTPGPVEMDIDVPASWKITPSGCTLNRDQNPIPCRMTAVAKRSSRTVTVTFTAPAGNLDTRCYLWVYSVTPAGLQYPDIKSTFEMTVPVTKA